MQLAIEGTLGLLADLERRHSHFSLILRKINQDSLENFFGCVRMALGGGRDVSIRQLIDAEPTIAQRKRDRAALDQNVRARNAGGRSERVVNDTRKKQRKAVIAAAVAAATAAAAAAAAALKWE